MGTILLTCLANFTRWKTETERRDSCNGQTNLSESRIAIYKIYIQPASLYPGSLLQPLFPLFFYLLFVVLWQECRKQDGEEEEKMKCPSCRSVLSGLVYS